MEQIKKLNVKALENRVVKTSTTQEALCDVTPFVFETTIENSKLVIDKNSNIPTN